MFQKLLYIRTTLNLRGPTSLNRWACSVIICCQWAKLLLLSKCPDTHVVYRDRPTNFSSIKWQTYCLHWWRRMMCVNGSQCQDDFEELNKLLTPRRLYWLSHNLTKDSCLPKMMPQELDWGQCCCKHKNTFLYSQLHTQVVPSRSVKAITRMTTLRVLIVVWAVKHFQSYLYGYSCAIYTDHKALKSLLNTPQPSGRLAK